MLRQYVFLISFFTVTAHGSTPLEDAMTETEQQAAGLHKLNVDELTFLGNWISDWLTKNEQDIGLAVGENVTTQASASVQLNVVAAEDLFGLEQTEPIRLISLKARLLGNFAGWDGTTEFRLDNGQIWQQRVGGQYDAPSRVQPEVIIERGRFGYYLMVVETGRMVGVRRIK